MKLHLLIQKNGLSQFGSGKCIFYRELEYENINIGALSAKYNDLFLTALRFEDKKAIKTNLKLLKEEMIQNRIAFNYVFLMYASCLATGIHYIEELNIKVVDVFKDTTFLEQIRNKNGLGELDQFLSIVFEKIVDQTNGRKVSKAQKLAYMAKEYVQNWYHDPDLTVESVASHCYVHSSYLSGVFKKEFHISISRYILKVRMEKAKSLIQNMPIKISEVGKETGYSDSAHFSKTFKKYYGCSPSDFENR